jgi:ribosomal protein L40E
MRMSEFWPAVVLILLVSAINAASTPLVHACDRCNFILTWGSQGSGTDQFNDPVGVAVDASGNVYVTDLNNNRVEKFGDQAPTQYSMSNSTASTQIPGTTIPPPVLSPSLLPIGQVAPLIIITALIATTVTYLTLRTRQKRGASWRVCSSCGGRNRPENEYCAKCGTSLSDKTRVY